MVDTTEAIWFGMFLGLVGFVLGFRTARAQIAHLQEVVTSLSEKLAEAWAAVVEARNG